MLEVNQTRKSLPFSQPLSLKDRRHEQRPPLNRGELMTPSDQQVWLALRVRGRCINACLTGRERFTRISISNAHPESMSPTRLITVKIATFCPTAAATSIRLIQCGDPWWRFTPHNPNVLVLDRVYLMIPILLDFKARCISRDGL